MGASGPDTTKTLEPTSPHGASGQLAAPGDGARVRPTGPDDPDSLTRWASGLLAGALLAGLAAVGAIWWYRQAAIGWTPPPPRAWRYLMLVAIVLAVIALVLSVVAVARRTSAGGQAGGVAWAITAGIVLVGIPVVVGRVAPEGRHAVVVALDPTTGEVIWHVPTGGWALKSLAITGDVVTVLTVGGDEEPCKPVLRRVTLGVAEGTTLAVERREASISQPAPADFVFRGSYLIHFDGAAEQWRVDLAPYGVVVPRQIVAGSGIAGGGMVVVAGDGRLPLDCRV
ncbi:MAG TPA: hypothetical protein VID93_01320 [Acidimicrobiales bacterium]